MKYRLAILSACAAMLLASPAAAVEVRNWALGLPEPASPSAEQIFAFHDGLVVVITLITIFVLGLLLYTSWRFSEKRNARPSTTTHNTVLEVVWTVVPVLILIGIAIPSFKVLYYVDRTEEADMTLKIIGHQWYWAYEYPDHGNFTFDAHLVPDDQLQPGQRRLMDTDNPVVLPVGQRIRLLMTAQDVIHAWSVSDFGIKMDTVPGRINETWMKINTPGTYYGFCSELCGTGHAYMPIMVRAVPEAEFKEWVQEAQAKFARVDGPEDRIASEASDKTTTYADQSSVN